MQGSSDRIRELMEKVVEKEQNKADKADSKLAKSLTLPEERRLARVLIACLSKRDLAQAYLEAKAGNYERLEKLAGIS